MTLVTTKFYVFSWKFIPHNIPPGVKQCAFFMQGQRRTHWATLSCSTLHMQSNWGNSYPQLVFGFPWFLGILAGMLVEIVDSVAFPFPKWPLLDNNWQWLDRCHDFSKKRYSILSEVGIWWWWTMSIKCAKRGWRTRGLKWQDLACIYKYSIWSVISWISNLNHNLILQVSFAMFCWNENLRLRLEIKIK